MTDSADKKPTRRQSKGSLLVKLLRRERDSLRNQLHNFRALLGWRQHGVVRGERLRTRRRRKRMTLILVAAPLCWFGLALVASQIKSLDWQRTARALIAFFPLVWPGLLFMGAGLIAATSVLEERDGGTALHLALTPVPRPAIAAAKVLPSLRPFLWGALAGLPLYVWWSAMLHPGRMVLDGSWRRLLIIPVWPLRFSELGRIGLVGTRPPLSGGCILGALMACMDLAIFWSAVNLGAVYAIRLRSLGLVILRLGVRLLWTYVVLAFLLWLASWIGGLCAAGMALPLPLLRGEVPPTPDEVLAGGTSPGALLGGVAIGSAFFLRYWWQHLVHTPVTAALDAFADFDGLANEELAGRHRAGSFLWRARRKDSPLRPRVPTPPRRDAAPPRGA